MDFTQFILLFGALQGLLLGIILLWKKQDRKSNVFLALLITLIAFQTYLLSMDRLYDLLGCGLVNMFSRLVFLVYAPLIYFYVRSAIDRSFSWNYSCLLHFLPFLLLSVVSSASYQTWGSDEYEWLHYIANTHYSFPILYETLRLTYLLIYILLSVKWLNRYKAKSRETLSNGSQMQINWLYQFLGVSFLLWCLVAAGLRFNYFDGNPHSNAFQSIFFVLPVFIYWVSFKAFTHPQLFQKIALSEEIPVLKRTVIKDKNSKYQRSGLKKEMAIQISDELNSLMKTKKPYLTPNLTLAQLSGILDIPTHHLSQVLNEYLDCNFYEFINRFRVEEAKNLLPDPAYQHFTIEAIAFECGFSSKSTFNTLFKKQTGITPGQWRKIRLSGKWEPA